MFIYIPCFLFEIWFNYTLPDMSKCLKKIITRTQSVCANGPTSAPVFLTYKLASVVAPLGVLDCTNGLLIHASPRTGPKFFNFLFSVGLLMLSPIKPHPEVCWDFSSWFHGVGRIPSQNSHLELSFSSTSNGSGDGQAHDTLAGLHWASE